MYDKIMFGTVSATQDKMVKIGTESGKKSMVINKHKGINEII